MIDIDCPTLSHRMEAIVKTVSPGTVVADVGCDHAFIPIYLVKNGICPGAIAMDIAKGPLETARSNIERYGCSDKIETRLSDGLTGLKKGEAGTVIIAGMGGHLICKILKESYEVFTSVEEIILSPQSDIDIVRSYLSESFKCIKEKMVEDEGKYYTIMKYAPGREEPYSKEELFFGRLLIKNRDKVFLDYLEKTKEVLKRNIENIKSHSKGQDQRLKQLEKRLETVECILGRVFR